MQVLFESRASQGAALRDLAEGRLRFVLKRLGWKVPRVQIALSDINGPRGGIDKRCSVRLATEGAQPVVATAMANHWPAAIDQAARRAAQAVRRQLARTTARRRAPSLARQPEALA